MVQPDLAFSGLFIDPGRAHHQGSHTEIDMNLKHFLLPLVVAAGAGLAGTAAAHGIDGTVKPNFSAAIPNIPGKSLIAVEVLYPPGGATPAHSHAKSAFIYAYVVSGSIASKVNDGPERVYKARPSPKRRARTMRSAAMPARHNPPSCWPCSSWTAPTPNSPPSTSRSKT